MLQFGRVGDAGSDAGKVTCGRVARAAAACAVEVRAAGLGIAGEHGQRTARVAVADDRLDSLVDEMREIDDLVGGERRLMIGARLDSRPDQVPQAIAQDHSRSDQIRSAVGPFGRAAMTVDAVLRVERPSAVRGGVVYSLTLVRPALREAVIV